MKLNTLFFLLLLSGYTVHAQTLKELLTQEHLTASPTLQQLLTDSEDYEKSEEPIFTHSVSIPTAEFNNQPFITVQAVHKYFDFFALFYSLIEICSLYQKLYGIQIHSSKELNTADHYGSSGLQQVLNYIWPTSIDSLVNHGQFLWGSCSIVVKSLLFKTIAKLIVLCSYGDITDIAKYCNPIRRTHCPVQPTTEPNTYLLVKYLPQRKVQSVLK